MKNKIVLYCFALSFICWLIPFLSRICFIEMPEIDVSQQNLYEQNIVNQIFQSISNNDNKNAFMLIFTNNLKGCVLNIFGGVVLGLGTFFNILINGFYSADMFVNSYKAGLSVESILKVSLPHSFELIGFWLSGAIGFYVAWNIYRLMRGKDILPRFYRHVGLGSLAVFVIILAAAYVEAYISTSFVTQ